MRGRGEKGYREAKLNDSEVMLGGEKTLQVIKWGIGRSGHICLWHCKKPPQYHADPLTCA